MTLPPTATLPIAGDPATGRISVTLLKREGRQVGSKDARWPMHFCGNNACCKREKLAQLLGQLDGFLT
jgi:hypothetical protein